MRNVFQKIQTRNALRDKKVQEEEGRNKEGGHSLREVEDRSEEEKENTLLE